MYRVLVLFVVATAAFAEEKTHGVGRPATAAEIGSRDLTVLPDGTGLPPGKGNAQRGASVYQSKCATCHNDKGEGREGQYPGLVGGRGSLASLKPVKSIGSFWPYATTLWDYVRRGMPYDQPRTLSADDVYSVTAFVLFLNGLVGETQELNEKNLAKVEMPNRNGFVPDSRPVSKARR